MSTVKGILIGAGAVLGVEALLNLPQAAAITNCSKYSAIGTDFGILSIPEFPASFKRNGTTVGIFMRLDTGSDITFVPRMIADALGVNLRSGTPIQIRSIDGISTAYVHSLDLLFGSVVIPSLPVAISERDDVPFLLGCLGLLDRTNVSLNGRNQSMCVEG